MSLWRTIVSIFLITALTSCGTARFYSQAARGQWEIQRKARPIEQVIKDTTVPPETRQALAAVPGIRQFAIESLDLPTNGSYTTFAQLDRRYAVWVVYATEEFSTEPKLWWYPVVGSLAYRGFFSEASARALADHLAADGWETFVGGVEAYSTLGVLPDPVLNTFLHNPDTQVAELIFHELTHQRVYLSGDTEFNEALATAYAEFGVRQWLTATGRHRDLARYNAEAHALRTFITLALNTRQQLAASYTTTAGQPPDARRAAKQAILSDFERAARRLRHSNPHLTRIDRFFDQPVTNARLATLSTYYSLVPAFEALLARHAHSPADFFDAVETLAKLRKPQRHQALQEYLLADGNAE